MEDETNPAMETKINDNDNDDYNNTEEDEYIDMQSALEVVIDDDVEPMSDDNEDMEDMGDDPNGLDYHIAPTFVVDDNSNYKIKTHADAVYNVSIDSDGRTICSGGGDDVAYVHKLGEGGAVESKLLNFAHKDSVSCSAFNSKLIGSAGTDNNSVLAVGSYDGSIQLYNSSSNTFEKTGTSSLEGPSDIEWITFHPNGGTVLLAGSNDGTVWMYHLPTSKCLQVFVGHSHDVVAGCFTSNGKFALSAGADGTVKVWAPKTGACRHSFAVSDTSRLTCMEVHNDLILVGCEDGTASLLHVKNKKILCTLPHAPTSTTAEGEENSVMVSIEAVGFYNHETFKWCATAASDGILKIWDLSLDSNNPQCRSECNHNNTSSENTTTVVITRMKWHATLPIIFTCANNGIVYIWDARSGVCLKELTTGSLDVCINDMDIWFGGDNGEVIIVIGGDDCMVRVFCLTDAELLQTSVST